MKHISPFQTARLKLTLWYILLVLFLLSLSTFAAVKAEQQAFDVLQNTLGDPAQRPRLTLFLNERIDTFEQSFKTRLFLFDGILLLFASGASYFLSGRTLRPIQRMMKKQEDFAADASHELRTPLTTINMEIEALKRTEKSLSTTFKDAFESIQDEVARMSGIVDGLLLFVRPGNNEDKKTMTTFDIIKLAHDCYKQMEPLAKAKHIILTYQGEHEHMILAQREKIKQVVLILLDNAIKYTSEEGTVSLHVTKHKSEIVLEVKDTGMGISQEDLPHVFDRFYRAKNTPAQADKGTGLGLAIAKKIVENYNGKISVKSEPERGSAFIVELPSNS